MMTLPDTAESVVGLAPTELYINGRWMPASSDARFEVWDPSIGRPIAEVSDAGPAEALSALRAAADTQPTWSASSPASRADLLMAARALMSERAEMLARLLHVETGKPRLEAAAEVDFAMGYLRWQVGEALQLRDYHEVGSNRRMQVFAMRRPVGPCLLVTPWTAPLAIVARKLASALAAGNTCVLVPSALAPLSALALAAVFEDAGLPPGVLNVIPTTRPGAAVEPLWDSPQLAKVSFSGSARVGRDIALRAAGRRLPATVDVGGNAPFLVFRDADLECAVRGAVVAKLRNAGQTALAANRFLVHESVAAAFEGRLAEEFAKLRLGGPSGGPVDVGPLIRDHARQRIHGLVLDAAAGGARILTGGNPVPGPGWYYAPTVLSGLAPNDPLFHQEILGPVAGVSTFSTEDEAVALANAFAPGSAAYAFTSSTERAFGLAERLGSRVLAINRGVLADYATAFDTVANLGYGREPDLDGIDGYTRVVRMTVVDSI